jgi:hypothetical protein
MTSSMSGRLENTGNGHVQFVPGRSAPGEGDPPVGLTQDSALLPYGGPPIREIHLSTEWIVPAEKRWYSRKDLDFKNLAPQQFAREEAEILKQFGAYIGPLRNGSSFKTRAAQISEVVSKEEIIAILGYDAGGLHSRYRGNRHLDNIKVNETNISNSYPISHEMLHYYSSDIFFDSMYNDLTQKGFTEVIEGFTDYFSRSIHLNPYASANEYDVFVERVERLINDRVLSVHELKQAYFQGDAAVIDRIKRALPKEFLKNSKQFEK